MLNIIEKRSNSVLYVSIFQADEKEKDKEQEKDKEENKEKEKESK